MMNAFLTVLLGALALVVIGGAMLFCLCAERLSEQEAAQEAALEAERRAALEKRWRYEGRQVYRRKMTAQGAR